NDRDWNHVTDFWTGNGAGRYTMASAAVTGNNANTTTDQAIKLIELSVAAADRDGTTPPAGTENAAVSTFAVSSPKSSYWYMALFTDATLGATLEATYRQDTQGQPTMGSVHNTSKFGFI